MLTRQEVEDTFKELDELHEAQSIVLKRVISSIDECTRDFNEAIEHYKKLAWEEER